MRKEIYLIYDQQCTIKTIYTVNSRVLHGVTKVITVRSISLKVPGECKFKKEIPSKLQYSSTH